MSQPQYALDDIAHRLRVATHMARIYIDLLANPNLTAEGAADIRADLRGYLQTVITAADILSPVHAFEDTENVVHLPAPQRRRTWPVCVMPPGIVAIEP